MLEFILSTIFWTLAFYGLFELVKNIIYICTYTKLKSDGIYVIIAVKNQEDKIEGFLRSILFKILYGREEELKNVIVADLESKDDTKTIAKKLSKDYECLKVLSWKETRELMDNVDEN
ncbi:MAG: glycosyltransferase [Clostridia bacterium]|nr:glycosyltransferase [Clostridium sp.]MBS6252312.1 glycosyltransferase [Clostridium sp.]